MTLSRKNIVIDRIIKVVFFFGFRSRSFILCAEIIFERSIKIADVNIFPTTNTSENNETNDEEDCTPQTELILDFFC